MTQHVKEYLHFFFRFILQSIFSYTLKCSFHIESFFCRCLEIRDVSLRSTPSLCFLFRNLQREFSSQKRSTQKLHVRESADNPFKLGSCENLTTRLLPPSTSILFPNTTNGKFSGSDGLACPSIENKNRTDSQLQ